MFQGFDNTSQNLYVKWVQNPLTFCFCLFFNLDHSSGQVLTNGVGLKRQLNMTNEFLEEPTSDPPPSLCLSLTRAFGREGGRTKWG